MKTDYTPRDIYEFIIIFSKTNGLTIRQAHIQAVRLTWRMFNQIKFNRHNITEEYHKKFVENFFEWMEFKRRDTDESIPNQ